MRKSLARILLPKMAATPSTPVDGELWYDTVESKARLQESGKTIEVRSAADLAQGLMFGQEAVAQPVRESFPQYMGGIASVATSATMHVVPVYLFAGDVITNMVCFYSGTGTAVATPSRHWMALYTPAGALAGQTADQLTAAWTANAARKLPLTTPYTVPASGIYYAVFYWVVGTAGTMFFAPSVAQGLGWADLKTKVFPNGPTTLGGSAALASTATAPATLPAVSTATARIWLACM